MAAILEEDLRALLNQAAKLYAKSLEDKDSFRGSNVGTIVRQVLPNIILNTCNINPHEYLVKGSIGQGGFAEIPWIAIFRKEMTVSATEGIYIVYLFTADMQGIYLSLNQGFTFFQKKYGQTEGRNEIRKVAQYLRNSTRTIPDDLSIETIDLGAKNNLGKGYMAGHIAGIYYDINNLPTNEKLQDDLRRLMVVYDDIFKIIGGRRITDFYEWILTNLNGYYSNDEEYIDAVEEAFVSYNTQEKIFYTKKPKVKKEAVRDIVNKEKYPRDAEIANRALHMANYRCEVDVKHLSFIRRSNQKNYTEAHHLIPLNYFNDFDYSLDIEENLVSLCSNCHNCLHYGVDEEREMILEKLYDDRKELLKLVGLEISLDKLKDLYDIKGTGSIYESNDLKNYHKK